MSDFEYILACLLVPIAYILSYIAGKNDVINLAFKMLAEKAEETNRKKSGWIPCSERLPEEPGDYLVQIDGTRMMIGHWNDGVFRFNSWFIATDRIVAWQPLPAPYQPENDDV